MRSRSISLALAVGAIGLAAFSPWEYAAMDIPDVGWGSSPRVTPNHGTQSGAAAAKRAARRRRNVRKHGGRA